MKVKVLIITALALAMSAVSFGQNSFTVDAGDGGPDRIEVVRVSEWRISMTTLIIWESIQMLSVIGTIRAKITC